MIIKNKKFILCAMLIALALCLFSCGNDSTNNEIKEIDMEKMASDILATQPFGEELVELKLDVQRLFSTKFF